MNPYPPDPAYGQPPQQPVNPYPPQPVYGQPAPRGGGDRSLLYVLGGVAALVLVVVVVAMFGMRGTGDPCLDAPRTSQAERRAISDAKERECIAAKVKAGSSEVSAKAGCILASMGELLPETEQSRQRECEAKEAAERAKNPVGTFASDNGLALGVVGLAALAGGGFFLYRRQQNKGVQGAGYGYVPPPAYQQPMTLDDLTEPGAAPDTDNDPYAS